MRRQIGVALLSAAAVLSPAAPRAESWTVTGTFGQTFRAVQDFDAGDDASFRSTTSVGFNASSRTPSTSVALSTALRFIARSDASANQDDFDITVPAFNAVVSGNAPVQNYSLRFIVDPEFVSARSLRNVLVEDPDTGDLVTERIRVDEDPLQIDLRAIGRYSYTLDTRNNLTTTASIFRREYDERSDRFVPTSRATLGLNWLNALTSTSSAGLNSEVRYFRSDRSGTEDTLGLTLRGQGSYRATARHNLSGSAGITALDDGDDVNLRFSGTANLAYTGVNANYRLGLSQDVRQDDDGTLDNVLRINTAASYRLTQASSFRLGAVASLVAPVEDTISTDANLRVSLSAAYTHQLAERWGVSVGAGLRVSERDNNSSSELDSEGSVFLRLSRSFDVLP